MNYTIRQALIDLVQAMQTRYESYNGPEVQLVLLEDLLQGNFRISSSVCPYTLSTLSVSGKETAQEIEAYVEFNTPDQDFADNVSVNGNPTIRLPLQLMNLNDPFTFDQLLMALTTAHPFKSARHLKLFAQTPRPSE